MKREVVLFDGKRGWHAAIPSSVLRALRVSA
jgi:hypothetical protein